MDPIRILLLARSYESISYCLKRKTMSELNYFGINQPPARHCLADKGEYVALFIFICYCFTIVWCWGVLTSKTSRVKRKKRVTRLIFDLSQQLRLKSANVYLTNSKAFNVLHFASDKGTINSKQVTTNKKHKYTVIHCCQ